MAFSLNPPVEYVTLRTRLTPNECYRRLKPVTLPWHLMMLIIPWAFTKLPVMGWVSPSGFALRKITIDPRRLNSTLQPEAKAQFVVAPDGTRMRVRLGPRRWVIVFAWIGTAYIVLFGEALMLLCRWQGNPQCKEPLVFLWPLLLPALLYVLAIWSWRLVRDERAFLARFLKQTLEAEEAPQFTLGSEIG